MDTTQRGRAGLVIASNRGPVERRTGADGRVAVHRGSGGLIAVLGPALASHGGVWVAAALTDEDRVAARELRSQGRLDMAELPEGPIGVRLLDFDPADFASYYRTVSTELLWFVQHHLPPSGTPMAFGAEFRAHWDAYRRVNDAFATACAEAAAPGANVLLQDYHLTLAARRLRELRPDLRSAHCTMTPWADPAHFAALPDDVQRELVSGLLGADLVCFLVPRWAEAFMSCCEQLGLRVDRAQQAVCGPSGRWSRVRCFPVGVDAASLRSRAAAPDVSGHERQLRALAGDARLVVRVDRMEPSKNIVRGLEAYARFLEQHPEQHGSVVHFVLAYASRGELAAYRDLAAQVGLLAAGINQRFGTDRWQPVVLETRNDFGRGLAAMALADVMVVNPVRDGMNLVAKEAAVLSRRDLALVLSRNTGAADDLADGCVLVDPFDIQELADAIAEGLVLPAAERTVRLERLRKGAVALPPDQWLREVLEALAP